MRTIALANQKGGVGKTATAQNLAAALSRQGHRVLAVDLDPQANLSMNAAIDLRSMRTSMYDVLVNDRPLVEVIHTSTQGFDVAVSTPVLVRAEAEMRNALGWVHRLTNILRQADDRYDICLIDTPPTIVALTVTALCAADAGVIVPFTGSPNAVAGLQLVAARVEELRAEVPHLRLLMALPNRLSMWKVEWRVLNRVAAQYPELHIADPIPRHADFVKAELAARSILDLAPNGRIARQFLRLADEVHARIQPDPVDALRLLA